MSDAAEQKGFRSWHLALTQGQLSAEQLAVLQDMVEQKQAETLEAAASMLDWQDSVIDPPEHMYGF
jgi:hypothetical protein